EHLPSAVRALRIRLERGADDPIPAGLLGQVKGLVSLLQESLDRPRVVGGIGGDADTDRRLQHPVPDADLEAADARAYALGDSSRSVQVSLRQEDAELLAAVATGA